MKNTNRIRKNGSKPATVAQGANITDSKSAAPATKRELANQDAIRDADKFTLVVFATKIENENFDDIGGLELSRAEFNAIKQDAAARGETYDDWFQRTLEGTSALRALKIKPAPSIAANARKPHPNHHAAWIQIQAERGEDTGGLNFTPGEFAAIEADAAAHDETTTEWLVRALEESPWMRSLRRNVAAVESLKASQSLNGRAA